MSQNKVHTSPGLYGLVLCGGNSRRMGEDKSMLQYYDQPQCYYLYKMLEHFCEKVFISCNTAQAGKIEAGYPMVIDLPIYSNIGPMASLLSGFDQYPEKDFLIVGCDYPFLKSGDISDFFDSFKRIEMAAAFYNSTSHVYEPLLAYYNYRAASELLKMHANNEHSLQYFLKKNNATKFYASNTQCMKSIDAKEEFIEAKELINKSL